MKPYQLQQPHGEWVDLDTIQSIQPPNIQSRYPGFDTISLSWRHAFQNEPRELTWQQPLEWDELNKVKLPVKGPKGGPSVLEHVHETVFEPFFLAWTTRDDQK